MHYETIIRKKFRRYPLEFPAIIDLMPLMSFQAEHDPTLEICRLVGSASVSLGGTKSKIENRDHDITYTVDRRSPRKTRVDYESPSLQDTKEQEAVWNEVQDDLGAEFPEMNINLRLPIVSAPDGLGLTSILQLQTKTGHFTSSLRKRFGLRGIRSPYRIIKYELQEKGLWEPRWSKKLRGTLKMDNILGVDEDRGMGTLLSWPQFIDFPEGHRFPPQTNQLCSQLVTRRWWDDVGVPVRMLGATDSREVEAILYRLKNREDLVTA